MVGGILEGKRSLEFVLEVGVGAEGEALCFAPLGVEAYEVTGNILDALLRALLDALPRSRADSTQRYLLRPFAGAVVGELVQAV